MANGYRIEYVPGWDCHGLPIELKAQRSSESCISPLDIRMQCQTFAEQAMSNQMKSMQEWGLLFDPDQTYRTMDPIYESNQLKVFSNLVRRGLVESALKPVYWSPSSQTALAEAELEYTDRHPSLAAFVRFEIESGLYFVIWTTTPWTLPGNRAVAINPELDYVFVQMNDTIYIVGLEAYQSGRLPISGEIIKQVKGSELVGLKFKTPFTSEIMPVLSADYVTADTGTGVVHIAPSYGMEDYQLCKAHGIDPFDVLDPSGNSYSYPPNLEGLSIWKNEALNLLGEDVLKAHMYQHRVPIDWRTKKPVIQRATQQLFINTSKLKAEMESSISNIQFIRSPGNQRLLKMIESRPEWCISRQRLWGVPIPAFYLGDQIVLEPEVIDHVAELIKENGSNFWWTASVSDLLPQGHWLTNEANVRKGTDTLDVWFDSGCAWASAQNTNADLYLEGSDQYRGWFQSSVITSVAATNKPPMKSILSHGFVVDENGSKMSKSIGNVVAPSEIIKKSTKFPYHGIDILRGWVAASDFTKDIAIGPEVIRNVGDIQQKIRNTCRFMIGNLSDFDYQRDSIISTEMWSIDRAAIRHVNSFKKKMLQSYEEYQFRNVIQELNRFCAEDLSSFYFEVIKDRLYSEKPDSKERRSIQMVLEHSLEALIHILRPIFPFMAEELVDARGSIVKTDSEIASELSFEDLKLSRKTAQEKFGKLDKHTVYVSHQTNMRSDELRELFGASQLELKQLEAHMIPNGPFRLSITPSSLHKCPRCWMHYSPEPEELCPRCNSVLNLNSQ